MEREKEIGKRNCVKCGILLKEGANKLWCSKCLSKVNEELEGRADRDFRYYFKWNLRHKK